MWHQCDEILHMWLETVGKSPSHNCVCFCTQCVDAVEELSKDILFLQEVHRDLRQRCAKLSSWLWGPAQFPNLHISTAQKSLYAMKTHIQPIDRISFTYWPVEVLWWSCWPEAVGTDWSQCCARLVWEKQGLHCFYGDPGKGCSAGLLPAPPWSHMLATHTCLQHREGICHIFLKAFTWDLLRTPLDIEWSGTEKQWNAKLHETTWQFNNWFCKWMLTVSMWWVHLVFSISVCLCLFLLWMQKLVSRTHSHWEAKTKFFSHQHRFFLIACNYRECANMSSWSPYLQP